MQQTIPEALNSARLYATLDAVSDAVFVLDPTFRVLYINHEAEILLERSRDVLLGKNVWDELPEVRGTFLFAESHRALVQQTPVQFEEYDQRMAAWFAVRIMPTLAGLTIYIRDITANRMLAARLDSQEERLRAVIEGVREVIFQTDERGCWTLLNGAWTAITGYPVHDSLGRHFLTFIHPIHQSTCAASFDDLLSLRTLNTHHETLIVTHSGETRWLDVHGQVEVSASGAVVGITGTLVDITARKAAEARFRAVFEHSPNSIVLIDPHDPDVPWKIVDCNAAACALNGYAYEELIGMSSRQLDPTLGKRTRDDVFLNRLRQRGALHGLEYHLRKDGTVIPVQYSAVLIMLDGQEMVLGIDNDIAANLEIEQQLRESEERFRQIAEHIREVFWLFDVADNRILFVSSAYEQVFGRSRAWLFDPSNSFADQIHADDRDRWREAQAKKLADDYDIEYRVIHPNGTQRWVRDRCFPVHDAQGQVIRLAGIAEDVTVQKEAKEQLRRQARVDSLTGLPNRVLLLEHLERALARTQRHPGAHLAVLFLDLDRFKTVNDSLGHAAGDTLITDVARRLGACLRPSDTFARLGGDEFVVLLEDIASVHDAIAVAERIQALLIAPFDIAGQQCYTTVSIGIALSGPAYHHSDELLRDADTALYQAKAQGRARYALFDMQLRDMTLTRLQMERDLRRALVQDELTLYYQPIVSLEDGCIVGVEALVRWQHPDRGMISPNEFIPLAEETGLIIPLGEWVVRTACTQLVAWQASGFGLSYVAVNVAASQLHHDNGIVRIPEILAETGLQPSGLKLELTESTLMQPDRDVMARLEMLRNLGVRLAIDDFGTGYSSLSYLQRLPVDSIKIDRTFVRELPSTASDVIVAATVAITHSLKLGVIAEGVETQTHLDCVRRHGCHAAQGYLLSRPLPVDAVLPLLQAGRIELAPQPTDVYMGSFI